MQHNDGTADTEEAGVSRPPVPSYSTCIAECIVGPPRRGRVHSVFTTAANIIFPDDFVLSLNTASSPRMPNGIQLPISSPLSYLRPNMPVVLGANRLCFQPLDYVLDLTYASQWNPHIERPQGMDMGVVQRNFAWIEQYVLARGNAFEDGRPQGDEAYLPLPLFEDGRPQGATPRSPTTPVPTMYDHSEARYIVGTGDEGLWGRAPCGRPSCSIIEIASAICGRGQGLTPDGDDILAGWMGMGWLVHGPQPDFLAACRQIVAIARQRTHLLSQCWLEYAARGYVAEPILTLLHILTQENRQMLTHALNAVLAMGATSGYNVIQGILLEQALYSSHST